MTTTQRIVRLYGGLGFGKLCFALVLGGMLVLAFSRPFILLTGLLPHAEATSLRTFGYGLLLIVAFVGAFLEERFRRIAPLPLPIILFLLWCGLSLAWSASIGPSFDRFMLTSIVVWLAFLSVDRLGTRRLVLIARLLLLLALLVNYAFVAFDPSMGIHDYGSSWSKGQWRGAMSHKNIAGTLAAITILLFAFHGSRASRLTRYAVVIAAAVFLGFTQSRTSMIGAVVALAVGRTIVRCAGPIGNYVSQQERRRLGYGALTIFAAIGVLLLLLTLDGDLLIGFTSDPDFLSGRSQIWQSMIIAYLRRPFSGAGYGAFWTESVAAATMARDASRLGGVTQGHNGYLDIALQVGLPGLLLSLVTVVALPIVLIPRATRADLHASALAVAILVFFLINNMTESSLFDGDQIPQVFAMLALAILTTTARSHEAPSEKFMRSDRRSRRRDSVKEAEGLARLPDTTQLLRIDAGPTATGVPRRRRRALRSVDTKDETVFRK